MVKLEIAKRVIATTGGIAKTSELVSAGIPKYELCKLCNDGKLVRVRHGYYRLPENYDISEEQLIKKLLPESVICVESALFHYGYIDFMPRRWTLAVPRTISRTKLKFDEVPVKIYYIPIQHYELGVTISHFNGVELLLYDRERTICDCFKYRSKLDNELFNKAINAYVSDDRKNISNLSRYARELGLFKRVNDLMEVMLNG